jgi:hypothetical protein
VELDGVDCATNASAVKKAVINKPQVLVVTKDESGVPTAFPSYTKAAEFVGTDRTYLSRCINKQGFYKGNGYTVEKKISRR